MDPLLAGSLAFVVFCVVAYAIFGQKSNKDNCESNTPQRSSKDEMMSRAPLAIVNLNDTPSTPEDTLNLVKEGCDVQTVATSWSYPKTITHVNGKGSSDDAGSDQYFDRFGQDEEVSTRPIVGGKRNDTYKKPRSRPDESKKVEKKKGANSPAPATSINLKGTPRR